MSRTLADCLNDYRDWGLTDKPSIIRRLPGGLTNHNVLLSCGTQTLLLRLNNPAASLNLHRPTEQALHQQAAQLGLTPPALYWAPDHSYLVRPYIPGHSLAERRLQASDLPLMAEMLAEVHEMPAPANTPVCDTRAACVHYLAHVSEATATQQTLQRKQALEADLAELPAMPGNHQRVCHLDPLLANWLKADASLRSQATPQRLWLLDWEYAALAHPALDYAAVASALPEELRTTWQSLCPVSDAEFSLASRHVALLDACWRLAH